MKPLLPRFRKRLRTSGGERVQGVVRSRVVDESNEAFRQAEELPEPVRRQAFQLGRSGRRPPDHRVRVDRRGQQFGENGRGGSRICEVRQEARMIPVREARNHPFLEVTQDVVQGLALPRRRRRPRGTHLARAHAGQNRVSSGGAKVLRDPFEDAPALDQEFLGRHVSQLRDRQGRKAGVGRSHGLQPRPLPTMSRNSLRIARSCSATRVSRSSGTDSGPPGPATRAETRLSG